MFKIKIASIFIIVSLLLEGCTSKAPNTPINPNTQFPEDPKIEEPLTNDTTNSVTENVPPPPAESPKEVVPPTNVVPNKDAEPKISPQTLPKHKPKAAPQDSPKSTKLQPSNSTQHPNYNAPNTAVTNKNGVEYLAGVEDEVLRLCNIERSKVGVAPLIMDSKVRDAARFKANEMLTKNYFSHTSPYTGTPFDLMKSRNIPFGYAGENIEMSQGKDKTIVTAQYITTNWMNSPGHRANILNGNYKKMGIGVAFLSNGNKAYESQLFTD